MRPRNDFPVMRVPVLGPEKVTLSTVYCCFIVRVMVILLSLSVVSKLNKYTEVSEIALNFQCLEWSQSQSDVPASASSVGKNFLNKSSR